MNTIRVRQNIYAAFLDGDATAVEALQSLCHDYEELDSAYRDYERMREQTRDQLSRVVEKLDGRAEVAGFGVLTISAPVVVEGFDKQKIRDLIVDLVGDHPEIAGRLAACATKSARAGGLRIERKK